MNTVIWSADTSMTASNLTQVRTIKETPHGDPTQALVSNGQVLTVGEVVTGNSTVGFQQSYYGYISDFNTGAALHHFHISGPAPESKVLFVGAQLDAEGNAITVSLVAEYGEFVIRIYNITTGKVSIVRKVEVDDGGSTFVTLVRNAPTPMVIFTETPGPRVKPSAQAVTFGPGPKFDIIHKAKLELPYVILRDPFLIMAAQLLNVTSGEASVLAYFLGDLHNITQLRVYSANLYTGGAMTHLGQLNVTGNFYEASPVNAYNDGTNWWVQYGIIGEECLEIAMISNDGMTTATYGRFAYPDKIGELFVDVDGSAPYCSFDTATN